MQQPSELQNQMTQQPPVQQVILCPVRLVYDTQILVRPGDCIEPNQTIYIRHHNTPPWLSNSQQQPRLMYTQLSNDVPSLQYNRVQNQLYSHNSMNYQPIPNTMLIQNQQMSQLQLSNVMPCNMMENTMTNFGTNIRHMPSNQTFVDVRPTVSNIPYNSNIEQRILSIENKRVDQAASTSFQGHNDIQNVRPGIFAGRQEQNIVKPQEILAINTSNTSNITNVQNTSCNTIVSNVPRMPNTSNIPNSPRIVINSSRPNMINVLNAPKITNIPNTSINSNMPVIPNNPNITSISSNINVPSTSNNIHDLNTSNTVNIPNSSNITDVPNTPTVRNNSGITNISNDTRALNIPNIPIKTNIPNTTNITSFSNTTNMSNIPHKTNISITTSVTSNTNLTNKSRTYIPNITNIINSPKPTNIQNTPSVPNSTIFQNNINVPNFTNIANKSNNTPVLNFSNIACKTNIPNTTSMTNISNTTDIPNIPCKTNIPNNTSNINIPYTANIPDTTSISNVSNKTNNNMVTSSNNLNSSYIQNVSNVSNTHNLKGKTSSHLSDSTKQKLVKTQDVSTSTSKVVSQRSHKPPNFKLQDINNMPQTDTNKKQSGKNKKVKDTLAPYTQRLPNSPYNSTFKSINDREIDPTQKMLVVNEEHNEGSTDPNKKNLDPNPLKIDNDLIKKYQNETVHNETRATIVTNNMIMNYNDVTRSIRNDELEIVKGNHEGKNIQITEKPLVENENVHSNIEVGAPKASDNELKAKSTTKHSVKLKNKRKIVAENESSAKTSDNELKTKSIMKQINVKKKNKKKIVAENEATSTVDDINEIYNSKEKGSQYQLRNRKDMNDKTNKNVNTPDERNKKEEDKGTYIYKNKREQKKEKNECYYGKVLTHVVEGFIIQESDVAFAIREPLKDKESQSNTQISNKQNWKVDTLSDDTPKRSKKTKKCIKNSITSDECEDKMMNEGNDAKGRLNGRGNPFDNLKKADVVTWTVDQLVMHLANHGWIKTALLLREHEIDGQSLFLASKQQLINIGVIESHVDIINEFIQP